MAQAGVDRARFVEMFFTKKSGDSYESPP